MLVPRAVMAENSELYFQGFYKDTVEFYFDTRDVCKNFWKFCLENHAFFRCQSVKRLTRHRGNLISRGSKFRLE